MLSTNFSHAQIMFQKHYGGSGDDGGMSVLQTYDNGFIVVGRTYSMGNGLTDVFVIRTDEYGDTLWSRAVGGSGNEEGYSVKKINDTEYIICGYTTSYGAGSSDVYLIKINDTGDTLWTNVFGGFGSEAGWDVIVTSDSGFIITGITSTFGVGDYAVYIIKADSDGNQEFTNFFELKTSNIGNEIIETSDGNYLIVGTTFSSSLNSKDCFVAKIDINGDTLWTKKYGGFLDDWGNAIIESGDGNYIVMGGTESFGAGGVDVFLTKISPSGTEIWTKTIGGSGDETSGDIELCSDLNFVITCSSSSFSIGDLDVLIAKTNTTGDTLWTRTYGLGGDEIGTSIKQSNDNGFIISGFTTSYGGNYDAYLVKTNPQGVAGIDQTHSQNYFVKVFPNPCYDELTIEINRFFAGQIEISFLGLDGTVYKRNIYRNYSKQIEMNISNIPSGIYLLKIVTDSFSDAIKLQII
jgi:hypothetical protein